MVMDRSLLMAVMVILGIIVPALAGKSPISSNSVVVALLDSQYTELAELVEKASLLQVLEDTVTSGANITIFAPNNTFLERGLDPDFRRFLHEPGNVASLQKLLRFHVLPRRISAEEWKEIDHDEKTLSADAVQMKKLGKDMRMVDLGVVTHPNAVVRPDGVIHGIDRVLVPQSVQDDFNLWRSRFTHGHVLLEAVMPQGAPSLDSQVSSKSTTSKKRKYTFKPKESIYDAMAPGPSLAPAPAPGPGKGKHHFDGESQVKDFIQTLVLYGGYNEMADILVNLTSLATEMGKLISEGYRLTVLAPNDEAMGHLTAEQLSQPGAPEQIVYYHLIPEYQTEESFYTAVRRFGKVKYDTLCLPHKMVSQEADGTVMFGDGEDGGHLLDHDIYVDGRISVQGIDKVLFPAEDKVDSKDKKDDSEHLVKSKPRKLEELQEDVQKVQDQTNRVSQGRFLGSVCNLLHNFSKRPILSACASY